MKFYTTVNQDFEKITRHIHSAGSFLHDKILKSFDKGLITGMILFTSKRHYTNYHDIIFESY